MGTSNRTLLKAIIMASTFLIVQQAYAITTEVRVDKIRYCRTFWPICNDTLQSDYHYWEDHGVPDQIQKQTLIGRYNQPDKYRVKHLVLLAAGQRDELNTGGQRSLVTGQPDFSNFGRQESGRTFTIAANSLPYRLFQSGTFNQSDTFMALAFDARFNWGFSNANKNDIVNAYYDWLMSKVFSSNLETIYLAGHSRGGALVMRLAKKFQQNHPNVKLVLHTFDPVPNRKKGELGAFNSYINNPTVNYPRDTGGLNNLGNWSYKSDLRNFFSDKTNLSVYNYLVGGKIFGLAQEVRSVSHQTGTSEHTDLAWYQQQWIASHEDAGGHQAIATSNSLMSAAVAHAKQNFSSMSQNMAPLANVTSSSTYCSGTGLHCYKKQRVNDADFDSQVGGYYSWTNGSSSGSQWVQLNWNGTVKTNAIEVITSEGYPIRDFDVKYYDGGRWQLLKSIRGNTHLRVSINEGNITTGKLRIVGLRGPSNQPQYYRINEIIVRGSWAVAPNKPPVARCNASPSSGEGRVYSTLDAGSSYDPDGSIVDYRWRFSDGVTAVGETVQHLFIGEPDRMVIRTATVTVKDNDGARSSASCSIRIYCESDGLEPAIGSNNSKALALCPLR